MKRRLLCYLRPGAGKTLTAIAVFLRLKFDIGSLDVDNGICLVVTEANLMTPVWMRQAYEHGVLEYVDVLCGNKEPGVGKQLLVVSFTALAIGSVDGSLDLNAGTLFGRKIVGLLIDEAQRMRERETNVKLEPDKL